MASAHEPRQSADPAARPDPAGRAEGSLTASPDSTWIGVAAMQATRVTESPDEPGGELVLWIELPSALLVGHAVVATGEGDAALVRVLHAALERPAAGPPRRPARLRVAESSQAFALRGAGIDIPIDVGFSPEIEDVVEQILATMRDSLEAEACGFLDGGLSPALMGDLFASARTLHASAPWRLADDAPDVRLDIPDLGVEGACVVMMGGLGRSTGLLAFPSLDDYDAFLEACDACETEGGADFREHLPGDASWLSLSLLPAAEVTEAMRREVVEHGWTPPADGMLPVLTRFERGDAADLDDRDVCVAAACADALSLLVVQHPEALHDDAEPLSVTYRDPHGLDVRVTLPYESFEDFEPRDDDSPARRAPARKIGRNEPCFCGSGRKYKQCHLRREQDVADRIRRFSELLELDVRVLSSLVRFAVGRFGAAMLSDAGDFVELGESDLSMHWFAHDLLVEGRSVSDWALDARELSWTAAERGWIRSQDRAWLSLWLVAVRGADGAGELRDLLSGATRRVSAVLGKSALEPGRVCLGRVVEHAGTALLSGVHSRSLPAAEADAVVRDVRAMFRRTSDIPIEHLRPARVARRLVERWTEALLAYDERVEIDLPLSGPEASAVVDLFVLRFGALHEVGEALARLRGVEAAGSGTDHSAWRILEPSPTDRSRAATRLVGRATLTVDLLRVGWVDEASADRWRVRLESVCEDALKHARRVRGPHEVAPGTHDAAPRDERSRQLDLGFGAAPAAEGPRAQGIPE